jgi:hypothetical protein
MVPGALARPLLRSKSGRGIRPFAVDSKFDRLEIGRACSRFQGTGPCECRAIRTGMSGKLARRKGFEPLTPRFEV